MAKATGSGTTGGRQRDALATGRMAPGTAGTDGVRMLRAQRNNAFGTKKRQRFIDALALTCNIRRSAEYAGVGVATVYTHRAQDAVFAEQWRCAFAAGYERLEALLLEHGGAGVPLAPADPARAEANGADVPFDFDRALKVLQFHRATRDGAKLPRGARRRATREETNAALLKALAAAQRRVARLNGDATTVAPGGETGSAGR